VSIRSTLDREPGDGTHTIPGYRHIRRSGSGFHVSLAVDRETQKARRGPPAPPDPIEFDHRDFGTHEFWSGTKQQLQERGFGVGIAFPGEADAPWAVSITTPSGLPARIETGYQTGSFYVRAYYRPPEEREQASATFKAQWITHQSDGLKIDHSWPSRDIYTGSMDALCRLGVASPDEFPGAPGRGKTMVTYRPDGRTISKGGGGDKSRGPGWRQIFRRSAKVFSVEINVSSEEEQRRQALHAAFDAEQEALDREAQEKLDKASRAKRNLNNMPDSVDAFRRHVVNRARSMLRVTCDIAAEPAASHGFTMDVEPIMSAFDAIVEAVVNAEVHFDAERHQRIAQDYRAQMAGADTAFRGHLAKLTEPNAMILAGEQQ